MVRPSVIAMAGFLLAACAATEATPAAGPSGGEASLQSPPFTAPTFHAPPGQPTTPASPRTAPAPVQAAADDDAMPFAAIAQQFDPAKQHMVWVMPPGIHGKGPWDFKSVVKHRDEVKFEKTIPLRAEISKGGSRPEYPAGYEVVRLTDDGTWAQHTAEIDKVIADLIAQHGRGQGSLDMTNDLNLAIDPAYKQAYCVENKPTDLRFYLEEDGVADLIRLDITEMAGIIQIAVRNACED
jgi:hypothetical protein